MSSDRPASEAAPIGSRRLALTVSAVVFVVAGGLAELSVRLLRPEWRLPPARVCHSCARTPEGYRVVADALAPAITELVKTAREPAPGAVPKPAEH